MGTFSEALQHGKARRIPSIADFRARVKEAAISIESALVAAEMLATHGLVESLNYERLIDLLQEANAAVDQIDVGLPLEPTTVFPTRASADAFIVAHPPDLDCLYQLRQDGIGRCTIAVFRLVAHL
jgi:hypothetical protein